MQRSVAIFSGVPARGGHPSPSSIGHHPSPEPLLHLKDAFAMLGVGKTLGFEMLNDGRLERVRISARRVMVTPESVRRVIAEGRGAPSLPLAPPRLIKRPRA